MEILKVENLTFSYPESNKATLSDVSFSLEKGDFAVLCGPTGSGKTTLLRLLKPVLAPKGNKKGEVVFENEKLLDCPNFNESKIGFVMQNPEQQIVTDKVWHELSFALENKNLSKNEINRRIAEAAQFFSLSELFYEKTDILSGGQKQLLNLASVAVMQPDLIILDEPTAQLDPVASSEFVTVLKKLNEELGITVLISEHSLDGLISVCNKLLVLENGSLTVCGETEKAVRQIGNESVASFLMPAPVRLHSSLETSAPCPLTVSEGKKFLTDNYKNEIRTVQREEYTHSEKEVVSFENLYFRFRKDGDDILSDLSFRVYENEVFAILGANGSGKTTALRIASGLLRPYSGKVRVFSKKLSEYKNNSLYYNCVSLVPQDIGTVFLRNTVREELGEVNADCESFPFDLTGILDRHPYDISGGEQQLVALCKALASKPKLLLLDEPTKGLDAIAKKQYSCVISDLKKSGVSVIIVTHDIEFACETADRCMFMFRGQNVSCDTPSEFFAKNEFYTSYANRMARGFYDGVVTVEDILALIERNGGEIKR